MKKDYIFGLRPVLEAIHAGKVVEKVLFRNDLKGELFRELMALVRKDGISFQFVPVERLNRITRKNHQGVVAFLSFIEYTSIEQLVPLLFEKGKMPFIVVLDAITDVRNLGAIARTAECAGVHALVLPAKGSAQINADTMKVSAGALHSLPVCKVKDIADTIKYLKDSGLEIMATTEKGYSYYYEIDYKKPIAIIMGAEDKGISHNLLQMADKRVKIPILGNIESLNVSAAAAIIMYEAVKQREEKL